MQERSGDDPPKITTIYDSRDHTERSEMASLINYERNQKNINAFEDTDQISVSSTIKNESTNAISSDEEDLDLLDEKRMKLEDNCTDGNLSDSKLQENVDRRRERNRVLARKTRQRKKVFYEALQRQVAQLVKENEILRGIVQTRKITDSKPAIPIQPTKPVAVQPASIAEDSGSILEKADYRLVSAIQASQRAFVITNPAIVDNPIIFASKGFLDLTRYRLDQVLGRNCRLLQGPGTDLRQVDVMRKGIAAEVDTTVTLLNYRADGTPFYNQVFTAPLRNKNQKVVNYVGIQMEVEVAKLGPVADKKKVFVPYKAEHKDFKDEEEDHPACMDQSALEALKAPTKPASTKMHDDDLQFDFDDFL
mmetsp:Transcript_4034/g.4128  ORF Transcript_4034/g.4128 Transcript_4034/m.4128 type:complete len:364 (+) Transcript_4034:41-1132(+)